MTLPNGSPFRLPALLVILLHSLQMLLMEEEVCNCALNLVISHREIVDLYMYNLVTRLYDTIVLVASMFT